jgi:protein ImuA
VAGIHTFPSRALTARGGACVTKTDAYKAGPGLSRKPLDGGVIDAALGGGLPLGVLHEMTASGLDAELGASTAGFIASLLAHLPKERPIFWVTVIADLYPPGLIGFGLNPSRLIMLRTACDDEALAVSETVLRAGVGEAVVAEIGRAGSLAGRRLQLACMRGGTSGFVMRRFPFGAQATQPLTAAVTRWRITPAPTPPNTRSYGAPCWRVELRHARNGLPGSWIVQQEDHPNATHPFRLVAALADTTSHQLRYVAG